MNADSSAVRSRAQLADGAAGADYYRADIDGLRAIAVLAVVGFHAFPAYFPGGFVGVDVFFVISGFLISSLILRQLRCSTFTLSQFYGRRMRRILPALVIVLAASLAFGVFVLLPDELEHLGKHVAAAAGFVSNFALWQEGGYFDRDAELKPLLHLWSLGIEEQFYLVWPMLLLLLWRRQQNIAAAVVVLTLASFALSITVGHEKRMAGFYLPFSRFWELGLGCVLAIVKESPGSMRRWLGDSTPGARYIALRAGAHSVLPIVGIVLIGAAIFLFDRGTAFPGWAALMPTAGAMCVIGADCNEAWNVFVKYIEEVKPPVVVVVGGGSFFLQRPAAGAELRGSQLQSRERTFKHGLKALFAALQKTSRVIYVRELPHFDSAPSCFLRPVSLPGSRCSPHVVRSAVEETMASYNRIVDDIQRELPELRSVDSIAALCDESVCSQKLPSGEIIYSDAVHLSPAGGRYFARTSGLPRMIDQMSVQR